MFQKTLEKAVAGDNVGILLRGVDRENIENYNFGSNFYYLDL